MRTSAPFPEPPPPPKRPRDIAPSPAPPPAALAAPAPSPEDEAACDALAARGEAVVDRTAPIAGAGGCGVAAPVSLRAVILADGRKIGLAPAPVMRCDLAAHVAGWLAEDVAPLVETPTRRIARIENLDAYDCRGRNNQPGAKLSEHGKGDAVDFSGVRFANGTTFRFTDRSNDLNVATLLRTSACARFTTVLGPGSDGFHESHVHLDLEARKHGGRICEWNLR